MPRPQGLRGLGLQNVFANLQVMDGFLSPGRVFWVDPANGSDANDGITIGTAVATLLAAYNRCTAGMNDTVILVGNGGTTGTARVDAAFTWAKAQTHLIGVCSPGIYSQRARIAPTVTTTAFAAFFTISADGCIFRNIQWFHGFNTGVASAICLNVSGSRNVFKNCHIAGMGDAASAQNAGSRSLKIGSAGSGENLFEDCSIGIDTVTRTVANASLELAGGTPRNIFRRCDFPLMTSNAGVLGILGTGASCVDRFNTFEECTFTNAIKSTSTQMTVLASFTNAAPGGALLFKACAMIGVTKFGDANALANSFLDMPVVSAAAGGLMLAPT